VAQVAQPKEPFAGRGFNGFADISLCARTATVAGVLKLQQNAVRIAEKQLGDSGTILQLELHRSGTAVCSREPVIGENLYRLSGVESLHAYSVMAETGRALLLQRQILRSNTNAKHH
jgi:hypothetical protein